MGYMTIVSILNDGWDTIKEHPDVFLKNIDMGQEDYSQGKHVHSYPVGNYANPMEVHTSFHANSTQILAIGGNHMENLKDLQENRDDDFYLAYKLRLANTAIEQANQAIEKVVRVLAIKIVDDMKRSGKGVDDIAETCAAYETFRCLPEKNRIDLMCKIAIGLQ